MPNLPSTEELEEEGGEKARAAEPEPTGAELVPDQPNDRPTQTVNDNSDAPSPPPSPYCARHPQGTTAKCAAVRRRPREARKRGTRSRQPASKPPAPPSARRSARARTATRTGSPNPTTARPGAAPATANSPTSPRSGKRHDPADPSGLPRRHRLAVPDVRRRAGPSPASSKTTAAARARAGCHASAAAPPDVEHQAAPAHPTRSFSEPIHQPDQTERFLKIDDSREDRTVGRQRHVPRRGPGRDHPPTARAKRSRCSTTRSKRYSTRPETKAATPTTSQ